MIVCNGLYLLLLLINVLASQADDVVLCMLQAVPCLLLAFFAHPTTSHWFPYRVRNCCGAGPACTAAAEAAELLYTQGITPPGLLPASRTLPWRHVQCHHLSSPQQQPSSHRHMILALCCAAGAVGGVRLRGGSLCVPSAEDDAECQGARPGGASMQAASWRRSLWRSHWQ